ncbi:MAG TPA: hypothetical protein VLN91_02090 [Nitrospirota bacterium]|nr:hypothetical protein [Nitrospirota bacterium]
MLIAIAIVLMIFVPAAVAQTGDQAGNMDVKKHYLYEWTDSKGGVHITDDLGEVPERYRAKSRKIEIPKGEEIGPEQQVQGATGPPSGVAAEEKEAASKAAWQKRLRNWNARLADAQKRYQDLDQRRLDALTKWGGLAAAASGHLEGRAEADRIRQEMNSVQVEIDEAKNMVENVIPEEARKAGIPPGWLRE